MRWWPDRGLWRHPDFLRLWAAQIVSALGSRITRTALPMIAVLTIDASPGELGILAALGVAPGVVVGLLAGGEVDRRRKRPLLIGADLIRAGLLLTIPLTAWLGMLSMPQLYLVAALAGAASSLFQIADNTYLPALIGKEHLVEGNAKLEASDSVAETAGPGLGGLLVQLLTAPMAVIVDALSFLWSALWLSRIRARETPQAGARVSLVEDVGAGFHSSAADPLVGPTLRAEAVMSLSGGFLLALYMLVALESLGLTPATVGLIIGVGGLGSLWGAWMAGTLGERVGIGPAMLIGLGVGMAAALFIPAALELPHLAVSFLLLHQLIGDAFLTAYLVHALSLRQRTLPQAVLGRANASFHVLRGSMLPLGALGAGLLADAIGTTLTVWIGTLGGLLAAPLLLTRPLLRQR
jgi:predicted MFS family arabinose efflux permease